MLRFSLGVTRMDGEADPSSEGRHVRCFWGKRSEKPRCNGLDMYRGEDSQLPARHEVERNTKEEIYGSREKGREVSWYERRGCTG